MSPIWRLSFFTRRSDSCSSSATTASTCYGHGRCRASLARVCRDGGDELLAAAFPAAGGMFDRPRGD